MPRCLPTTSAATWRPFAQGCDSERFGDPVGWVSEAQPTKLSDRGRAAMTESYVEQLFGLTGQVAVVIGGTGVLGGALAEGLARAGAMVVVAGRDPERGKTRVEAIQAVGGLARFAPVDVTSRGSIEELARNVVQQDKRVDMLINGAGVNSASSYFEASDDEWDRVI